MMSIKQRNHPFSILTPTRKARRPQHPRHRHRSKHSAHRFPTLADRSWTSPPRCPVDSIRKQSIPIIPTSNRPHPACCPVRCSSSKNNCNQSKRPLCASDMCSTLMMQKINWIRSRYLQQRRKHLSQIKRVHWKRSILFSAHLSVSNRARRGKSWMWTMTNTLWGVEWLSTRIIRSSINWAPYGMSARPTSKKVFGMASNWKNPSVNIRVSRPMIDSGGSFSLLGKNNGAFGGHVYFQCPEQHGVFVRRDKIHRV